MALYSPIGIFIKTNSTAPYYCLHNNIKASPASTHVPRPQDGAVRNPTTARWLRDLAPSTEPAGPWPTDILQKFQHSKNLAPKTAICWELLALALFKVGFTKASMENLDINHNYLKHVRIISLSSEASYRWRGEVRQLGSVRAFLFCFTVVVF